MKKIIYSISFILLILLSCSSDSESSDIDNSLLFRKWFHVYTISNGSTNNAKICSNNGHRDYLEFQAPNTALFYYVLSSSGSVCSYEYAIEPFTFRREGNKIKMFYVGNFYSTITIEELTVTSFKFVITYEYEEQDPSYYVYSSY